LHPSGINGSEILRADSLPHLAILIFTLADKALLEGLDFFDGVIFQRNTKLGFGKRKAIINFGLCVNEITPGGDSAAAPDGRLDIFLDPADILR
jgi:hypothetical protein